MLDGAPRDPRLYTRWLLIAKVTDAIAPSLFPFHVSLPYLCQQNHRYSRPFNGQLYDAIIMYRFRSRLLVFSMYRGYRSRVNRTGNEFSV